MTKHGDLAGPRALEHAVDVVLAFEGDARSGLRVLSSGKNRFGAEGETAWFEMGSARSGQRSIRPPCSSPVSRRPDRPSRSSQAGRRALAVEVRLSSARPTARAGARRPGSIRVGSSWSRRCSTERQGCRSVEPTSSGRPRAASGVDDPASDLAVAAALASAATGAMPPAGAAFVGEISLTGSLRSGAGDAAAVGGRARRRVRRCSPQARRGALRPG